ncbi:alpha/beta hydrolase [Pusillimonas sp. CC-YST705]|uniref:Alpha/beta hydrolase n=1 Tax=Mesopusillimonas faecipullorum TaxID=2755040 RepID=A0ABS8CBG6_9BURK|nr:alpha/beta hydrolase [Mesopusillimonas faecipullorum]MCB5363368.1 alpha/beta hydrolase [Mesopusillimonas faecipullorum]
MSDPEFETLHIQAGPPWACLRAGAGRPLLLIHGSLCDARFWQGQLQPLAAAGYSVIAPSLPAYYPLHVFKRMRWQDDLEALSLLLEHLSHDQAIDVVGHSRGGFLAYQLARLAPDRVRRLVLAEPGGSFGISTSAGTADKNSGQAWRQDIVSMLQRGEVEYALTLFVDGVSRPGSWRASPQSFRQMALDNASTLLSQLQDDTLPNYLEHEVSELNLPVLLVKGQRSLPRFKLTIDTLGQYLPRAAVTEILGAAHAMNLAHPQRFNQVVTDFLA